MSDVNSSASQFLFRLKKNKIILIRNSGGPFYYFDLPQFLLCFTVSKNIYVVIVVKCVCVICVFLFSYVAQPPWLLLRLRERTIKNHDPLQKKKKILHTRLFFVPCPSVVCVPLLCVYRLHNGVCVSERVEGRVPPHTFYTGEKFLFSQLDTH